MRKVVLTPVSAVVNHFFAYRYQSDKLNWANNNPPISHFLLVLVLFREGKWLIDRYLFDHDSDIDSALPVITEIESHVSSLVVFHGIEVCLCVCMNK